MNDSWDEMKRAKEEEYFNRENKKALERIQTRKEGAARLSPVSGKPMEQLTIMGVVVDRCPVSGGIWLDNGELEQILQAAQGKGENNTHWFKNFFQTLLEKKF